MQINRQFNDLWMDQLSNVNDHVFCHTHSIQWWWLPFELIMIDGWIMIYDKQSSVTLINGLPSGYTMMTDWHPILWIVTWWLDHAITRQLERNSLQWCDWQSQVGDMHTSRIIPTSFDRIDSNLSFNIDDQWNLWICVCFNCTCDRTVMDKWDFDCIWHCNYRQAFKMISCL